MKRLIRNLAFAAVFLCLPAALPVSGLENVAPVSGRGIAPVNGARLFYEVKGSGEPVVLIHGGQLDSRMWDDQFDLVAREFRVLRYDVRGYGASSSPDRLYSDREDLAALLDYVGMRKVHLVGLSLGGRISIDLAVDRPERVASLALAGPGLAGFDFPDPEGDKRWWALIQAARDEGVEKVTELWLKDPFMAPAMENPRLASRLRRLALENDRDWLANPILQRPPSPRPAKRLAEIKAPTLLILGDRDVPRIKAVVETLAKEVSGARKVVIAGAGHMVSMEKPEEFNRALLEFLRGQPRSGVAAR